MSWTWGSGEWVVHMTCCRYDEGWAHFQTWKEADAFRESYLQAEGHTRSAIIVHGPEAKARGEKP